MKILALEFSSRERSVAVLDSASAPLSPLGHASESGGRDTKAFALIETALRQANWTSAQIECLAVGIGPGSYAGIRASIAIAQGWQLARGISLLGISSVEAIAARAFSEGIRGETGIVVDAQRNEFYSASCRISSGGWETTQPLRLVSTNAVRSQAADGTRILGPDAADFGGQIVFPRALEIAMIAARRSDFVPGEQLEPIYLRETAFVKAPPPRSMD